MNIEPIAYFRSPLTSKFGIPRQSGLARSLYGKIIFEPAYSHPEAVRGLEQFDYLWLIWGFSANRNESHGLTVRPPRLGGNQRIGVFASRSPFRPNGLGLSAVYINKVETQGADGLVIEVLGADLMDMTPIYDIKPYVTYADSYPNARCGFVDETKWQELDVAIPTEVASLFSEKNRAGLRQVLSQDPRPRYHQDAERIYGMPFAGYDVRFRVEQGTIKVIAAENLP